MTVVNCNYPGCDVNTGKVMKVVYFPKPSKYLTKKYGEEKALEIVLKRMVKK